MKASRRYRAGWRDTWLSLLLSLALALNLLGPVTGLPEKDGFVPICTGSKIIYIPLAAIGLEQPAPDTPDPVYESCPWFAQFHALEVAPVSAGHSPVVYKAVHRRPADVAAEGQHSAQAFQARAPPSSGV
ncbi:MAG: hypothetical protein Kow00114_35190 [Kiloniellaceae bacterium]